MSKSSPGRAVKRAWIKSGKVKSLKAFARIKGTTSPSGKFTSSLATTCAMWLAMKTRDRQRKSRTRAALPGLNPYRPAGRNAY